MGDMAHIPFKHILQNLVDRFGQTFDKIVYCEIVCGKNDGPTEGQSQFLKINK